MKNLFQKMISLFRSLFKTIKFEYIIPFIMIWLIFDMLFLCNTIEEKIFTGITMIFLSIMGILVMLRDIYDVVRITARNTVIIYEQITKDDLTEGDLDSVLMNALKAIKENETIHKKPDTDIN